MGSLSLRLDQINPQNSRWDSFKDTLADYKIFCVNYAQGALEGMKTIVPISCVTELIANMVLPIDSCQAYRVIEKNFTAPFFEIVIFAPLCEELIFRGLWQNYISDKLFKLYVEGQDLKSEEKEELEKKYEKQVRICISSLVFSLFHFLNYEKSIAGFVYAQVVAAFVLGTLLGEIAESELGLAGACGAHGINNLISHLSMKYLCFS